MSYVNKTGSTHHRDGRWTHRLSQTNLSMLTECPESARARYFRETPDDDYTDSLARGTALHAAAEYACYEKRDAQVPSVAECIDVAHHELDTIVADGGWKRTKMTHAQVYDTTALMVQGFVKRILPDVRPKLIESRFNVPIWHDEQRTIYWVGARDCVDEYDEVWDWKTGSRPYEPWEKQRWAIQPTVYTYSLHADSDTPMPQTTFHYGVCFDDSSVQLLDVTRDDSHVQWATQQALVMARLIESGMKPWPLNDAGWWCSEKWCGKFAECKGLYMLDGWMKAPRQ